MDLLTLVILGLATHRLTVLWFLQGILTPIHDWMAKHSPLVALGVNCPLCVSTWFGLLMYGIGMTSSIGFIIVSIIAVGSVAHIINSFAR